MSLLISVAMVTASSKLWIVQSGSNDLVPALSKARIAINRVGNLDEALSRAGQGDGILALGVTPGLTVGQRKSVASKGLHIYLESPSKPSVGTALARIVVTSGWFGENLPEGRLLTIRADHVAELPGGQPLLSLSKVAGFNTAVFGLSQESWPVLAQPDGEPGVLLASAPLSCYSSLRFAPEMAWTTVWKRILGWVGVGKAVSRVQIQTSIEPSYTKIEPIKPDAATDAVRRGVGWFSKAALFLTPDSKKTFDKEASNWYDRVGPMPPGSAGDGSLGMLEGFNSQVHEGGSQYLRWWRRADCNGEAAMAHALAGRLLKDKRLGQVAHNLGDFLCFQSPFTNGPRSDPANSAYGLVGWSDPGATGTYYGDDNARFLLGMVAAESVTHEPKWDDVIARCLLANLRTSGQNGFRGDNIVQSDLDKLGWRAFYDRRLVNPSPHFESWLWACYLWAYERSHVKLFLERAKAGITVQMALPESQWRWTNGVQQERARMLLPLAWLVRVEDTPEHREWLDRVADKLLASQDRCGAIREELGPPGFGLCPPPASNAAYGMAEAPLIQENGDSCADMLYTSNFAFLGLHEAAAATGDKRLKAAEDKLADFLVRIQAKSTAHPELDGAWFRAFDFADWDVWGSDADAGWGAWSVESGWTQSWIVSVLALRQMKTNYWELTRGESIGQALAENARTMLPIGS